MNDETKRTLLAFAQTYENRGRACKAASESQSLSGVEKMDNRVRANLYTHLAKELREAAEEGSSVSAA